MDMGNPFSAFGSTQYDFIGTLHCHNQSIFQYSDPIAYGWFLITRTSIRKGAFSIIFTPSLKSGCRVCNKWFKQYSGCGVIS